jgi:hypothetical protein
MASSRRNAVQPATAAQQGAGKALASAQTLDALLTQDAGVGFEEAQRDAFAIPFVRILQDLSPQVKPKMSGYIKGAAPGDFFNTVTQGLSKTLRVIPCHYSQRFIEWVPRSKKGGFVAAYDALRGAQMMQTATRDQSRNVLPNGNELMDSREHYVLLVKEDGTTEGALIAMASTALKVSRRWMTTMRNATVEIAGRTINAPMFAYSYEMTTEEEANEQGSWYQWCIGSPERVINPAHYIAAKTFGAAMRAGNVKVNYDEMRDAAGAAQQQQAAPPRGGLNDIDEGGM